MKQPIAAIAIFLLAACSAEAPAPDGSPEETLQAFYDTAADADFEGWAALFAEDARFYGTDPAEDWPFAEMASDVEESFASGGGWDFEVRDRRVTLAPDGRTAWFADIAHFNTTDYTLRPTGVLIAQDGEWKIAQMVMGVPFPNEIYDPMRMALQAETNGAEAERAAVDDVLDHLHDHAAHGELEAYFALYTEDAMFFGTDETERWDMDDFRGYAEPAFADGEGWSYTPISREIVLGPMMNVAWFDEVLSHEKYANTRGSGVLIRTDEGWKIAQYNLTFLIPNAVAGEIDTLITDAK